MKIAFIHTDASHVARFGALLAARAPAAEASHAVAPALLALARREGPEAAREGLARLLAQSAGAAAVVCTCSTLGALAESLGPASGATGAVFRVDRPMMEQAAAIGPKVLLVACLDTAMDAARALFAEAASPETGPKANPETLLCAEAWPLFERGDVAGFAEAIAGSVRSRLQARPGRLDAVVLTQASMAPAAALLGDLGAPVLTSPDCAVARALALAGAPREA